MFHARNVFMWIPKLKWRSHLPPTLPSPLEALADTPSCGALRCDHPGPGGPVAYEERGRKDVRLQLRPHNSCGAGKTSSRTYPLKGRDCCNRPTEPELNGGIRSWRRLWRRPRRSPTPFVRLKHTEHMQRSFNEALLWKRKPKPICWNSQQFM